MIFFLVMISALKMKCFFERDLRKRFEKVEKFDATLGQGFYESVVKKLSVTLG